MTDGLCHLKLDVTVKDMPKIKALPWVSELRHFPWSISLDINKHTHK